MKERVPLATLGLASAAVLTVALPSFLVGTMAVDIMAELEFGPKELGLLVGIFSLTSMLLSGKLGRTVEHVGWSKAMRRAAATSAVACVGIATIGVSPWIIAGMLVFAGAANAVAHPAGNLALAADTPTRRRGLVFGLKHAAVPGATLLAGLAVPLAASSIGWRGTFAISAALSVLLILSVPRHRATPQAADTNQAKVAVTTTARWLLYGAAAAAMLGIIGVNAVNTFFVTFAVESGYTKETGALILSTGSIAGIIVRIAAGWWVDRRSRDGVPVMVVMLVTASACLLAMAQGLAIPVATVVALGAGWGWSGLLTFSIVSRNPDSAAAATGISQSGIFAGATFGPVVFGTVAERISFSAAWTVAAAFSLLAAGIAFMFLRLVPFHTRDTV